MPGKGPTPEQIAEMQRRVAEDAQKAGMTVPEFIAHIKKQTMQQQQRMRMQQQQQQQHSHDGHHCCDHDHDHDDDDDDDHHHHHHHHQGGQNHAITPGPPNPKALAVAKFLKVKRALRALQSPAYEKARKKNPLLPEINDQASLENTFKLLPLSMLALRVSKIEMDLGPNGKKPKRVKGQWNVRVEQQQEAMPDMYYVWLWEGSQIKRQLYAALALVVIFIIVLYPLWPLKLRQGVYYLSWGLLGLLGLFFLMAIFRVILFCVTYFAVPPGLWLYPNLWEDVSFMDSFRPVWAWHETAEEKKLKKKSKKKARTAVSGGGTNATFAAATGQVAPTTATTTGTDTQIKTGDMHQRNYVAPKVEELADDE
ncbi:hypothetical protein CP533_0078 [Ophiocordyceps camponoti-saundersi (nom. inval.)]|nr:hypothetical protein CP533_0078 [Ophiocordyceps camponoti-saundersi (nom. inval.)]